MIDLDEINANLADIMGKYALDPLGFAEYAFPWGEPGTELENDKLEDWQRDFLDDVGKQLRAAPRNKIQKTISALIQEAVSSGHGIGKSALLGILINWSMCTSVDTRGVITANTESQLHTKTWAELAKWHRLCIANHWFRLAGTSIHSIIPGHELTWKIDAIPWSLQHPEAFAGLHNKGKRILIIMDEASAIPKQIWEVAEGATTDDETEILFLAFGNPTRNEGRFYDCFHKFRHRWNCRQIDSRDVTITNKEELEKKVEDWGEDSDYIRIRVRGVFPRQSDRQFISGELVFNASKVKLREDQYNFEPVIIGVDAAIYGNDEFTIYLRQGLFSKKLAAVRKINDDFAAAAMIRNYEKEYNADAVFVDMGSGTGIVSAGRQLGRNWTLVPFGGESMDKSCLNKRAEMYVKLRDWLKMGGRIEPDPILESQLTAPEYEIKLTKQGDKLKLEAKADMKARGLESPDRADGLVLTFAYPVTKNSAGRGYNRYSSGNIKSYDPLRDVDENYNPVG